MQEIQPTPPTTQEGILLAHERGFGFVQTDDGQRHFVPPPLMKTSVTGDHVRFEEATNPRNGELAVSRLELLRRPESFWLGEIVRTAQGKTLFVCDEAMPVALVLPEDFRADSGTVVQVRVPEGAPAQSRVAVTVEHVLGPRNDREFDTQYAKAKWRLEQDWPQEALDQAEQASRLPVAPHGGCQDLRQLPFVTIDGHNTKDFDDAICVQRPWPDGSWHLRVAIADVSRYVAQGSALDLAARKRGTTVYFPDEVVPMLPRVLSNGVCSLNPGEDRYAVVVSMHVGSKGQIGSYTLERAVIRSQARLTYQGVSEFCEGRARVQEMVAADQAAGVEQVLRHLVELHGALAEQRASRGLMDMRHAEPHLHIEEDGSYGLRWEEPTLAHELVEECMLLANRVAAAHLALNGHGTLFRHHAGVSLDKWDDVRTWLAEQGIESEQTPSLVQLRELLARTKDHPAFEQIQWRVRRAFASAVYDVQETSHYSLGFLTYTHFTSPIRRYADLTVHRMLLGEDVLDAPETAQACSILSRNAQLASRYVMDRIKKRNLWKHAAQSCLPGQVAANTRRGIKVVVQPWDTVVFIGAEALQAAGKRWNDTQLLWEGCAIGQSLSVCVQACEQHAAELDIVGSLAEASCTS